MSTTMPDEIWAAENPDRGPCGEKVLPHYHAYPEAIYSLGRDTRFIRADRIGPAILAAMDETLAYFDEEFPLDKHPDRESWVLDERAGGLIVGMLRTLRGMFG